MKVAEKTMVEIDYVLNDKDGTLIDTSEGHGPLAYVQGMGQIIPGLESAMEGKSAGDTFQVIIKPEDGYGKKRDDLVYELPKADFAQIEDLQLGMEVELSDGHNQYIMTVVEITEDEVTVDGNHPLAGEVLHFDITVREVREATEEELAPPAHSCSCGDDGCSDDGCSDEGCSDGSCHA
jgi:FKBP-type peptidyl-prolyl cis-trans isomerase SlyD